ncbi:MAG: hypothetical protein ACXVXU_03555, partial [Blastococcus sp.]
MDSLAGLSVAVVGEAAVVVGELLGPREGVRPHGDWVGEGARGGRPGGDVRSESVGELGPAR